MKGSIVVGYKDFEMTGSIDFDPNVVSVNFQTMAMIVVVDYS